MSRHDDNMLRQEEAVQLLRQLIQLTQKNHLVWQYIHFIPITLLPEENECGDDACAALVHDFNLQAEYNERVIDVEVFEKLSIPSGEPTIRIDLIICRTDAVEENHFDSFPILEKIHFIDTVIHYVENTLEGREEFLLSNYDTTAISSILQKHPLTLYGKKLFEQEAVLAFHQAVVDRLLGNTNLPDLGKE